MAWSDTELKSLQAIRDRLQAMRDDMAKEMSSKVDITLAGYAYAEGYDAALQHAVLIMDYALRVK